MILIQILTTLLYLCVFSLEGWENVLFELRSERVKRIAGFTSKCYHHTKVSFEMFHKFYAFLLFLPEFNVAIAAGSDKEVGSVGESIDS